MTPVAAKRLVDKVMDMHVNFQRGDVSAEWAIDFALFAVELLVWESIDKPKRAPKRKRKAKR